MSKTALELTIAERQAYRPIRRPVEPAVIRRWERAWDTARAAAALLRQRFAATRVVAFGSVTHRTWFTPWSDIDLMAWGIPPGEFYRAVAAITGLSAEFEIDLVDPDTCPPALRQRVEQEGIEL